MQTLMAHLLAAGSATPRGPRWSILGSDGQGSEGGACLGQTREGTTMKSARLGGGSVLVLVLALLACAGDSPSAPSEALTGVKWQLQAFETADEGRITVPQPEHYTVLFKTDGRWNMRADCNGCVGRYQATSTALTIEPLGCTDAYCGDDSLDDEYVEAFATVSAFTIRGGELRLYYANGLLLFSAS